MSNDRSSSGHEALTKTQVRELIELYFHVLDTHDDQLWARCFAPDASMTMRVGSPEETTHVGRDDLVEALTNAGSYEASHHVVANVAIRLEGETTARATTFVVANLSFGPRIIVRGTRLDDHIVLGPEGWVFQHRDHRVIWQYEVAATVPPGIPPELRKPGT